MSRTYKDRPYWVIMNDRSLGTVEHHDHDSHWRRMGRYRIIERGERQLVPYGEHKWFLRHTTGTPGMTADESVEALYPYCTRYYKHIVSLTSGNLRWYYEQPQRFEWVGRVAEHTEYSDDCDLGPYRRGGYSEQRLCTVEPTRENKPGLHYYDRPPSKEFRKANEKRRRRNASVAMRQAVVDYNTHGEADDFDFAETAPPHALFGGGWWD